MKFSTFALAAMLASEGAAFAPFGLVKRGNTHRLPMAEYNLDTDESSSSKKSSKNQRSKLGKRREQSAKEVSATAKLGGNLAKNVLQAPVAAAGAGFLGALAAGRNALQSRQEKLEELQQIEEELEVARQRTQDAVNASSGGLIGVSSKL